MRLPQRLPARLPLVLFAVLALATVGAFSLTQHLKTANPLINGGPRADPPVINPRLAGRCVDEAGTTVSFRSTSLAFYLQSRSDNVSVYVFNADGDNVATMSGSGRHVVAGNNKYASFHWNGRLSDGRFAPPGTYTFHVVLQHEGRDLPLDGVSVRVQSRRPTPRVSSVTVGPAAGTTPAGATPYLTPGTAAGESATVHLVPGRYRAGDVLVYRAGADPAKPLTLVKSFGINPRIRTAVWDGMINGRPAPAGTYLLGLTVTDNSCTSGRYPLVDDPAPHSTAGAGVNLTYLSADPPADPVPAGQLASVGVNAGGTPYVWALRHAGQAKVIFRGTSASTDLRVRMPGAGLYALTLVAGTHRTTVPVVASAVGPRAAAKVLVVLPALSWQGADATDDDSDGLIDTLATTGDQITLNRPLVAGLPAGFGDEAALVNFLTSEGFSYDLTTDVALAERVGPSLTGHSGVLLDGTFTWLPGQLVSALHSFVSAGGGAFADGIDSLQQTAQISDAGAGPIAGPSRALGTDPFGVRHGAVSPADGQSILEQADGLDLFTDVPALEFPRYQVLTPADGRVSSAAGVAASAIAIVGFRLGRGTVVEAGLPDFGSSLASDVDSGELLSRVWRVVLR